MINNEIVSKTPNIATFEINLMVNYNLKELIEDLRWNLGLNISEIAILLRVTRSTIHRYINGKSSKAKYHDRLHEIHKICLYWKRRCKSRLNKDNILYKQLKCGSSLFDLLNHDDISTHFITILRTLTVIADFYNL